MYLQQDGAANLIAHDQRKDREKKGTMIAADGTTDDASPQSEPCYWAVRDVLSDVGLLERANKGDVAFVLDAQGVSVDAERLRAMGIPVVE